MRSSWVRAIFVLPSPTLNHWYEGADWLQGPYVYSLYREQYGFDERTVAVLFVTGFVSAGLTAPLVGVWADQQYVCSTQTPLI